MTIPLAESSVANFVAYARIERNSNHRPRLVISPTYAKLGPRLGYGEEGHKAEAARFRSLSDAHFLWFGIETRFLRSACLGNLKLVSDHKIFFSAPAL